jgi:hypothetical protein
METWNVKQIVTINIHDVLLEFTALAGDVHACLLFIKIEILLKTLIAFTAHFITV